MVRHGSQEYYKLLEEMSDMHNKKSQDYASDEEPFANYHFAGVMSKMFDNPEDAGFIGRLAEKLFRIANVENNNKIVTNESIQDTENDICVIVTLWVASRRHRRNHLP